MTLVLMLPGQGSQFVSMGTFLYDSDRVFRAAADEFLAAFGPGADELVRVWRTGTRQELGRGPFAQPLLFAVGYAAGRTLLAAVPEASPVLVGHSVGELAAATLAGVLDIGLAGALLRARAELLEDCPPGGLVACRAAAADVARLLRAAGLAAVIGAENAPDQCAVSAGEDELPQVLALLRGHGVPCMRVAATEPFHSPLLAPAAGRLAAFLAGHRTRLRAPRRPLLSAYSGDWVGVAQSRDPRFWTEQMARPVRFGAALARPDPAGALFVEAGPGGTLTAAAGTLPAVRAGSARVLAAMPSRAGSETAWQAATHAVRGYAAARGPGRRSAGG